MIFNDHWAYEARPWDPFLRAACRLVGQPPQMQWPRRAAWEVARVELTQEITRIRDSR